MSEGYAAKWSEQDEFLDTLHKRPNDVCYQNWMPFYSPKGQLMAFYNNKYSDIRIEIGRAHV